MEGLDKTDLSAEEQTVLDALAGVFQADDAGRITFMSLFGMPLTKPGRWFRVALFDL